MAEFDRSDTSFVSKLIAASKTLTNANAIKCEYEQILKELTMFNNFVNVLSKHQKNCEILTFTARAVNDSVFQNCENILMRVHNNSSFNFHPKFWEFSIEYFDGDVRRILCWKLEECLESEKSYDFIGKFALNTNYDPLQIKINLIFKLEWKEEKLIRIIPVGSLLVDVMYFLNPSRLQPSGLLSNSVSPSYISELDSKYRDISKLISTIKMFEFHFDCQLSELFVKDIFLKDCLHRGFTSNPCIFNNTSNVEIITVPDENQGNVESPDKEIFVYFQSEKITLIISKTGPIIFKCTNGMLLFSLKIAIFRRLLSCDGIKVVCPNDDMCDKLYAVKLKLEAIGRDNDSMTDSFPKLMELYLELRDVSEAVKFLMLTSID